MTVDQPRRDPAALAIDDAGAGARGGGEIPFRTGKHDAAVPRRHSAGFDNAETGCAGGERRETGVQPDRFDAALIVRIAHRDCAASFSGPRLSHRKS